MEQMKNIHLIKTNKTSRLFYDKVENRLINKNIYITSDKKIKEGDYIISLVNDESFGMVWKCDESQIKNMIDFDLEVKKIILTTDADLIKDGVQPIDDEFLKWFVKNPSYEGVEIGEGTRYEDEWIDNEDGGEIYQHQYCCYKIIIPQEEPKDVVLGYKTSLDAQMLDKIEPKQKTYEEAAESRYGTDMDSIRGGNVYDLNADVKRGFIEGAKSDAARDYWFAIFQQEQDKKMYSEEDLRRAMITIIVFDRIKNSEDITQYITQLKKK